MLHLCNSGYGCAIAINLVVVRVQRQLCYGFIFEKKAKSVTFLICVCGASESLGKRGSFYLSLSFVLLCLGEVLFLSF